MIVRIVRSFVECKMAPIRQNGKSKCNCWATWVGHRLASRASHILNRHNFHPETDVHPTPAAPGGKGPNLRPRTSRVRDIHCRTKPIRKIKAQKWCYDLRSLNLDCSGVNMIGPSHLQSVGDLFTRLGFQLKIAEHARSTMLHPHRKLPRDSCHNAHWRSHYQQKKSINEQY